MLGQASAGDTDSILMVLTSTLSTVWTRQFGVGGSDGAGPAAVDALSNIYLVGYTSGTLPGQASAGGWDAFIRKYDKDGTEVWTRQFGTAGNFEVAYGVVVDPGSGSIYVCGTVAGALSGQSHQGGYDAFVRKYDPSGTLLWTRQFGTPQHDWVREISVDSQGNIAVAGGTYGAFPGFPNGTNALYAFVRVLDAAGTERWTQQFGPIGAPNGSASPGPGGHVGWPLFANQSDSYGNVYVSGKTNSALPGQTAWGDEDIFVRKYDVTGAAVWTHQFGTAAGDRPRSIALLDVAGSQQLAVTGDTFGAFPGYTNAGGVDAFLRLYTMAATTTQITSVTPVYVGYPYTVSWHVSSSTPGTRTGNVTVSAGSASCTAAVATGSCSLTPVSAGSATLRVTYSGDGDYAGSVATTPLTINGVEGGLPTTTTVGTIVSEPSLVDHAYTVAVSVTSDIGTPSGTVTVSNGTVSCSTSVAIGTCSLTSTTAGSKTITAIYGGSGTYATSSGTTLHQVNPIPKVSSGTSITSISPASALEGTPYTVHYSVSPSGATGTVTVTDGTGASCSGGAPAGNCLLTSTPAGTKTITATYGGDSSYDGSTASASYVVTPSVTLPNAPTDVNAIVSSTTITQGKKPKVVYSGTISWTDTSNNETGFTIRRYKRTGRGVCQLEAAFMASVGANATTYIDPRAMATTCGYGVAATNSAGTSAFVEDFAITLRWAHDGDDRDDSGHRGHRGESKD